MHIEIPSDQQVVSELPSVLQGVLQVLHEAAVRATGAPRAVHCADYNLSMGRHLKKEPNDFEAFAVNGVQMAETLV